MIRDALERGAEPAGSAEARICNAITWYSRAVNARTQDEVFVGLTTALESLLGGKPEGRDVRITQRLSDSVSSLLGGNFESREQVRAEVKRLYGMRSRIVHYGASVSDANVRLLNRIVVDTIWEFISREVPGGLL